ncbi:hypothetical protein WQE_16014 [Paraburkholderia hospita]|uniref:Uncharacterized protein n=1 Tax=Paraburkholderia hospita TaxID=169430 RepID=A0ABP2PRA3_9BURK|nr:hypothetical protein [Paraburkholderia hospita]EIN00045.1 hypothetical protein WQE_16014 [Paraburkholderia hospita]OUL87845.1 hypothetical protein CA602_12895 [Paraburkholderia hospita]
MGATVLTGKQAAAFQTADGEWMFALFERTYEKNCYPHDDRWSAIAFGRYRDVMRRVFRHATSCEGGMLQSRAGNIRPENYIATWRSVLARPFRLPDQKIRLDVSKSYRASLPEGSLDDVSKSLVAAGLADRVEEIVSGKAEVSLIDDAALLEAIYGEKGPLSVWRVLAVNDCSSVVVDDDVKLPTRSASAMDRMAGVRCYKIDDENRLVSLDGQPWENAGWQYSAVGSFITDVAYEREMDVPGFAKRAIPAYRDVLRNADALPAHTVIDVTRSPDGVEEYRARVADELAVILGLADAEGRAPAQFSFRFGDVPAEPRGTAMYKLCHLCSQQVNWSLPEAKADDPVPAGSGTDLTQLILELA